MPQRSLIIFDLDGTLVNAYAAVASSLNFMLTQLGLDTISDEEIKRRVGWGDKHLILQLVGEEKLEKGLDIYRRHHAQALKKGTTFLPHAKKVLTTLKKKKYRLAIASNRPTKFTQIILRHLKVQSLFTMVLCGDRVKRPKPAGEMLTTILRKMKKSPREALYVGDMTIDVQTGHAARVDTVAVLTGSSLQEDIFPLNPYKIIDNMGKFLAILEEEQAQAKQELLISKTTKKGTRR